MQASSTPQNQIGEPVKVNVGKRDIAARKGYLRSGLCGTLVNHGDNLITMYFHLSEIKVTAGQEVKKGDIIGLVGTTGRSTGPHLFFGIRWHNARINPQFLLDDSAKIPAVIP